MKQTSSRIKCNPVLGMRPSLEFRRVHELGIDPTYQRSIDVGSSQALIRRIAAFWDWGLCQPLAVARRADGSLKVVDGQHRLAAARLRGDIDDLPCVVTAYANPGDEAAAFVALNQQRRPLSRLDLFKAAIAAEDETTLKIVALLEEAGLQLAPHLTSVAWKPGMVANIAGLVDCHRVHGEKVMRISLAALSGAFEGQVLQYAGTIFPGIYGAVAAELRTEGKIDQPRLVERLKRFTQSRWKQLIAERQAIEGSRRNAAAKACVLASYLGQPVVPRHSSGTSTPPSAIAPEKPTGRLSQVDPNRHFWCDQCDQRRMGSEVNRCMSPFCKATPIEAKAA